MVELQKCRRCGAEMIAAELGGLCPKCVAEVVFGKQHRSEALQTDLSGGHLAPGGTNSASPRHLHGEPNQGQVATTERKLPPTGVSDQSEKPGDCIGPYKLLEQIGEGGCGVVYMAEQQIPIRRRVALKVIKLGMDTRQIVARFEAERQALAMMDHPNIAKVYDAGSTATGRPFFVMELVRGTRITDYCDQNKLPTPERLRLFVQVCHAIQHAHQKGVIHRDIKPSNILVMLHDDVAVPKVIDFGIAKAMGEQLTEKTLFTRFEQFIGTPAYMSPEQAGMSGLDIDTRSDIYALGVLLYELLTGHTPFDPQQLAKAGMEEMLRRIREEEPPRPSTRLRTLQKAELTTTAQRRQTEPLKLLSSLRGDLDWIVLKCLEKSRARRYETANGLALDIERHLRHEPVAAAAPGLAYRAGKFARRYRTPLVTAGAFALLLVAGSVVSVWEAVLATRAASEADRQAARSTKLAEQESQQRLRAESSARQLRLQAYASDMKAAQLALAQDNPGFAVEVLRRYLPKPGEPDLRGLEWRYLWHFSRTEELQVLSHPGLPILDTVAFSRNGRFVVSGSLEGKTRVWDLVSGQIVREFEKPRSGGIAVNLAISPDGKWLAALNTNGISIIDTADWTEVHRLGPNDSLNLGWPCSFSADSKRLFIWGGGLKACTLADCTLRSITNIAQYPVACLPDGESLAGFQPKTGKLVIFNERTGNLEEMESAGEMNCLAVSPDGRWLAGANALGEICTWDLPARRLAVKPFRGHPALVWKIAFSPDSKVLASAAVGAARLWEAGTTNNIATLWGHLTDVVSLDFSPDSQKVATASKDGTVRIWKVEPARPRSRSLTLPKGFDPVGLLPDATAVAAVNRKSGTIALWSLPGAERICSLEEEHFLKHGCRSVQVFAGNKLILGVSTNGNLEIWDLPSAGHSRSVSLKDDDFVVENISPDRRWLIGGRNKQRGAVLYDLQAPETPCVFSNWIHGATPQFSPDGQWMTWRARTDVVGIYDLKNHRVKAMLEGHRWHVWSSRFSPDSRLIASGGADPDIRLWSMETFQLVQAPLKGHQTCVGRLLFSSDGKTLISDSEDMSLRWWNVATGQEMLLFKDAQILAGGPDSSAEWNPGGDTIVWWEPGGIIRITLLPTLAQIDEIEARRVALGVP